MTPEVALSCSFYWILIDLSAGLFSPVCHFLGHLAARSKPGRQLEVGELEYKNEE
jgi:hypothetical protein